MVKFLLTAGLLILLGRIASRNFLTLCLTEILTIWMLFRLFDFVHLGFCPD